MSQTSHDARAVVRAIDALTTQVQRLADARQTPTVRVGDGVSTTADDVPTPDFTSPLSAIEVRVPCPHCPPPAMIPRSLIAEHIAREHPEQAPAADEDAQRTVRRERLLNLLARLQRGGMTAEEKVALRQHVEAEMREADTARAEAQRQERMGLSAIRAAKKLLERRTTTLRGRAERAEAAIERVLKALDDRPPILNAEGQGVSDYETGWRDHDRVVRAALDGTEQPTTEAP